ncbi:MAG: hypothetical protein IPM37_15585 [Hahellaceae bacterium]|nr:hypothetical protein [Hahellaceae bacterium]
MINRGINALLGTVLLASLAACGSGPEGPGSPIDDQNIRINSVAMTLDGQPQSEALVEATDGQSKTIQVDWNVSFSSIINLYMAQLWLVPTSGTGQAVEVLSQNCSSSAGALYNCGSVSQAQCTLTGTRLECAVADGMKHSANINQDMRLEFRACLEDLTDDNRCDIKPVNLTFAKRINPPPPTNNGPEVVLKADPSEGMSEPTVQALRGAGLLPPSVKLADEQGMQ